MNLKLVPLSLNHNLSVFFINLALILYPVTLLLVPKMNGLIFGLFVLVGLIFVVRRRDVAFIVSRDEKLLYLSIIAFFLVVLLITVNAGFVYKQVGKYLYLLLAIPVYIYLRHNGVRLSYVWYGLAIGAIITVGIAINDVMIKGIPRARGLTHMIIFGDLALVMGCMSMAGLGWYKQKGAWQWFLPIAALFSGVYASILSQSRGGWIAIPFLLIILFWYIRSSISFRLKIILAVLIVIILGTVYTIPQTGVSTQIDRTINSLQQHSDSEITSNKRGTSVGTRLEMWQASWKMFQENPILGVGWGHYQEQAQLQVDQGLRNKSAAAFNHPHSQYFSALAHGGSLGFVTLMVLFFIPARLFVKYINHGETDDIKRLALAGLVLIVAYMAFGISEPMLERSRSVNFFAFYLAVFMAAIYGQKEVISRKS